MAKYGKLAQQVLELLATGSQLGFVRNRKIRGELFREADQIWFSIDRKLLTSLLHRFKLHNYIESMLGANSIEKIRLTNRGRARALEYNFAKLILPTRKKWDKKWRIVLFDIPEPQKKTRDALRHKLKKLGFLEFQKSVFIYPFPCQDEINFVINFFNIHDHVCYLEAPISPDISFRSHFKVK